MLFLFIWQRVASNLEKKARKANDASLGIQSSKKTQHPVNKFIYSDKLMKILI